MQDVRKSLFEVVYLASHRRNEREGRRGDGMGRVADVIRMSDDVVSPTSPPFF